MIDFVTSFLDLLFFPFDKSGSYLFLFVYGIFLFCFAFALIKKIMRMF